MPSNYTCSVFFFKQKTAYEMRISDWSSDVCSSDLEEIESGHPQQRRAEGEQPREADIHVRELEDRQAQAEVAEVDPEEHGRQVLEQEQDAARGEQLVDRRRPEQRRYDEIMPRRTHRRNARDGHGYGEGQRYSVIRSQAEKGVTAKNNT